MELLLLLVEGRGTLVTQKHIAATLWPGLDIGDATPNIHAAVKRIRAALGDSSTEPIYIRTVIGRGYRFIAPIVEVPEPISSEDAARVVSVVAPAQDAWEGETTETLGALPSPLQEPKLPRVPPSLWHVGSAVAVLLTVVVSVIGAVQRHAVKGTAEPKLLHATRLTEQDSEARVSTAAISADGSAIAYVEPAGVFFEKIGHVEVTRVAAPSVQESDQLAWLTDGQHLLMSAVVGQAQTPQVWMLSLTGAPALFRSDARMATPSPDGSQIAFVSGDKREVWLSDVNGHDLRGLFTAKPGDTVSTVLWSADGKLLFLSHRGAAIGKRVKPGEPDPGFGYLAIRVATGEITASEDGLRFDKACLLQSGRLLVAHRDTNEEGTSSALWEIDIDPSTGRLLSVPRPAMEDARVLSLSESQQTGRVIAVREDGRPAIFYGSLSAGATRLEQVHRLTQFRSAAYPHAWSRDGKSLFYESDRGGQNQLYRQDLLEGEPKALRWTDHDDMVPRLSPDGKWILFLSKPHPSHNGPLLMRLPIGGGEATAIDSLAAADIRCPTVGTTCVLRQSVSNPSGNVSLVYSVLDPLNGKLAELYRLPVNAGEAGDWDLSPLGDELVMIYPKETEATLRIISLRAGREANAKDLPVRIATRLSDVNWTADGKAWFVTAMTPTGSDLFHVDGSGNAVRMRSNASFSWGLPSPDGKKLAFIDQDVDSNVWLLQ
jgi:DNA-binding winged helix-turn-helix (wHTH) protein